MEKWKKTLHLTDTTENATESEENVTESRKEDKTEVEVANFAKDWTE